MTGTASLIRLILRRDRIVLPLWVIILGVLPISQTSGIAGLYPTTQELEAFAASMRATPAFSALYGPLLDSTAPALGIWRAGFIPVIIALASILMVIRHTRVEEESGRRELLGSTVLSRNAALTAALIVTSGASAVLGLIVFATFAGTYPVAGAAAAGLGYFLVGAVFAAVGAVAAQLTESASAARAIGLSALGVFFLVRMAATVSESAWLSWVSPLSWGQKLRPFAGEEWWPVLLLVAGFAVLAYAAYTLSARRDVGAGLLPPSLGPAEAAPGLNSPLALAWRMHRGPLIGWSAGMAFAGLVIGSAAQAASDALAGNETVMRMLTAMGAAGSVGDLFIAMLVSVFGLGVAGYAIQAALKARGEESLGRAEPLLAAAVGRVGWAGSHVFFAFAGPAIALLVAGAGVGLSYGLASGDVGTQLPRTIGAALSQLPAAWTLAGLALALFGLLPRLTAAAWGVLLLFLLFGQVGAVLELPRALLDLSPFTHSPRLPGGDVSAAPLLIMAGIAAALTAAGLYGFRRRDVQV
ncbi:ABC transporter permease [Nonomuraea sp. NPDC050663]|uniref:ABC transporter permease n=1 Tax=Nonomuraea sp. NPDC050663 TaxID=3364370 RepID=UPI0037A57C1A